MGRIQNFRRRFSSSRTGRARTTLTAVRRTVAAALRTMQTAKLRRTARLRPAPKRWAVMMARPAVKPITNPRMKNIRPPVQPTAARASTPSVRPTIRVSAML